MWEKISKWRGGLVLLLGLICFSDLMLTYVLLKIFPDYFAELNPGLNGLIQKVGLDVAALVVVPIIYFSCLAMLYYFWGVCLKEEYRVALTIVIVGYFITLIVRFGAIIWNIVVIHQAFS